MIMISQNQIEQNNTKYNLTNINKKVNNLKEMLDYAGQNGIFEDSGIVSRDLFDTKIMGQLVPPPSDVIDIFKT